MTLILPYSPASTSVKENVISCLNILFSRLNLILWLLIVDVSQGVPTTFQRSPSAKFTLIFYSLLLELPVLKYISISEK